MRQHPTQLPGRLSDTYVLDLASWTWRQVQYGQSAARPARRAFHSATAVEGRVLLFGGAARREGAAEVYYQARTCAFMCVCVHAYVCVCMHAHLQHDELFHAISNDISSLVAVEVDGLRVLLVF